MMFGQLTHRESIREIATCLKVHQNKVDHLGIKQAISHSTIRRVNESRDWRIYADFARLHEIELYKAFFVIRAKDNLKFSHSCSRKVDKAEGLKCDQVIILSGIKTPRLCPGKLRRIKYYDTENDLLLVVLTNNLNISALDVCILYRNRWQIGLFFKWIKQHLRIKTFWGNSPNAVKTQIWIAVCTYLLVAYAKKELKSDLSLYEITQILGVSVFDKTPIIALLTNLSKKEDYKEKYNQLNLFEL